MALFGNKESKEEKEARQVAELMERYGLSNLDQKDVESIKNILTTLAGTGLIRTGSLLSGMKSEDILKTSYLQAIFEQNWIMIRQLDKIASLLEK